ncbi:hypothetical protein JCM10212_006826 [Sporobolomyces blumeae]
MSTRFASSARQSMYPTPPSPSHWTALEGCSLALSQASQHLNGAIDVLHEGTFDLPRLSRVIHSRRAFDLVPSLEIQSAQASLRTEMSPQIQALVERAERGLEGLKDKERALRNRLDKRNQPAAPLATRTSSPSELALLERRLDELRTKKERMGREVERLEGEVRKGLEGRK